MARVWMWACLFLVVMWSAGVGGLSTPSFDTQSKQEKGNNRPIIAEGFIIPPPLDCGKCEKRVAGGRCNKIPGCDDGSGGDGPVFPF